MNSLHGVAACRRARRPRARGRSRSRAARCLPRDVVPDVELGPVREREDADALARVDAPVVEAPQLRALVLRVPLAELVAEGEDALLGARLLLVAPGAAEERGEPVLLDRVEQDGGLDPVAGCRPAPRARGPRRSPPGREATISWTPSSADAPVAELEHLGEVVPGVDVHDRERDPRRAERLLGEPQHHDRVLAAGEQQHRAARTRRPPRA